MFDVASGWDVTRRWSDPGSDGLRVRGPLPGEESQEGLSPPGGWRGEGGLGRWEGGGLGRGLGHGLGLDVDHGWW